MFVLKKMSKSKGALVSQKNNEILTSRDTLDLNESPSKGKLNVYKDI